MKKATMNTLSIQKSNIKEQSDTDDESDCSQQSEQKPEIEKIYSSPNCTHYRFNKVESPETTPEDTKENVAKHRSFIELARVAYSSARGTRCRSTGDRTE